ncbi:multicopper oxidase family protein [Streptomyces scopuliridis]|uniref:multicopper oxidase family protein n=1 Tax=Streptomyces scopuliridis TaxID=452529 RepID=UPI0036CC05B5
MYLTLSQTDFVLGLTLLPVWLAAAFVVRRLATRPDAGRLRRTARIAAVLLALATVMSVARLVVFGQLTTLGWTFVSDRRIYTTLLFLLPGFLATLVLTLPRVLGAARRGGQDPDAAVTSEQRSALAAVRTTLPSQLAAFGALGGFFEKFLPPHRAVWLNLTVYGGLLLLAALVLAWRASVRAAGVTGPSPAPRRGNRLAWAGGTAVVFCAIAGLVVTGIQTSKFPGSFTMMRGAVDLGGGSPARSDHSAGHTGAGHKGMTTSPGASVSVADLTGPKTGTPDRRFTLTAAEKKVELASGRTVDAWAFNDRIPGPELRMREGELVEITLVNKLKDTPVSSHWHGMDVPSAEDGVPGATQDAVKPGETYTYRFRVEESGSRWYHSHQQASEQVQRGLFGPLVIEPATDPRPVAEDVNVVAHDWETSGGTVTAFGTSDTLERRAVDAGRKVRLRLMNTSTLTKTFTLTGVPYRVTALDGTDLNGPGEIEDQRVVIAGAGRADLEFTMPTTPVRLVDTGAAGAGIAFSADGKGTLAPKTDGREFDKTGYGEPARTELGTGTAYDRDFSMVFDDWLGFYDGTFGLRQTVNGKVFPDTPMLVVKEGERIRMRFVNRGEEDHPMHLHGHHVQVISHNGKALTGSPVVQDTVLVRPGEEWEVAFVADNPGVWMDHCHNFVHTALGMVLHLTYDGVTSPYLVGGDAGNHPE